MSKRIIMFSALVVALTTLSGCGKSKTLTCTQENSESGAPSKHEIVYKFEDNKITSATQTTTITLEGDNVQYKDVYKSSAQQAVDDYKKDGMTAKVVEDGNKISVEVEMKPDKLSESDYVIYKMGESYESMEALLAEEGYTCK